MQCAGLRGMFYLRTTLRKAAQGLWAAVVVGVFGLGSAAAGPPPAPLAPDFPQVGQTHWLNSPPLSLAQLRGKPVLVEFWSIGCQNSRKTLPWLSSVQRQFGEQLQIIGVHTPEFSRERDPQVVKRKLRDFEIDHPVLLDNQFRYWNAMGNRHWPALYLIDDQGRIQGAWAGQVTDGSPRAARIESAIRALVP